MNTKIRFFINVTLVLMMALGLIFVPANLAPANAQVQVSNLASSPPPPTHAPILPFDSEIQPAPVGTMRGATRGVSSSRTLAEALQVGANHIIGQQNIDGGWAWPHNPPVGATASNILGPIGRGLVRANGLLKNPDVQAAAIEAGEYMKSKTVLSTYDPGFLSALSDATGDPSYAAAAETIFYGPLHDGTYLRGGVLYDTTSYVNLILTARGQLAAWDLADLAVDSYNRGSPDASIWINGVHQAMDRLDPSALYHVISVTGAIRANKETGSNYTMISGSYAGQNVDYLVTTLLSWQQSSGYFPYDPLLPTLDVQETDYAILALKAEGNHPEEVSRAVVWLMSQQLNDGCWEVCTACGPNVEVEGESLWAMSTVFPIAVVVVDDDWVGTAIGTMVSGGIFGIDRFAKVQDGVNGVTASTVNVNPGTYIEQLEISKSLTLQGQGTGTIIRSPDVLTKYFTTSAKNKPIVYVHDAADVTIRDLVVDGAGKGNTNNRFIGIGFRNAGGTVLGVEIKDVRDTPFSGVQHGVGLYNWSDDGETHSLTVKDSRIHDFQKTAMALNADDVTPLSVDIQGNTITGYGETTVTAQNGIQVWALAGSGTVENNVISGIGYNNTNSVIKWVASTILNYYSDLVIKGNSCTNGHVCVYNIDGAGIITENRFTVSKIGVSGYGIIATDPPGQVPQPFDPPVTLKTRSARGVTAQNVEIANNEITFSGSDNTSTYGIEADAGYGPDNVSLNVHNNAITGFSVGLGVYECQEGCDTGVFTNVVTNYNSISGNSVGMESNWRESIDASKNWWGSATGPTNSNNPGGLGDDVIGNVRFMAYLCGGVDTSPLVGFQPDGTYLCPTPADKVTITVPPPSSISCYADPILVTVTVEDNASHPLPDIYVSLYASSEELERAELLRADIPVVSTCVTKTNGQCIFNWKPVSGDQHLIATAGGIASNIINVLICYKVSLPNVGFLK